jgi:Fe-S cluster biosynthesis and repair protein YggX
MFPYGVLSKSTATPALVEQPNRPSETGRKDAGRCTMRAMAECDPTPAATQAPAGNTSGRTVHCVKFQKDLPGLDAPPWPGELGQRIYENVSVQAWKMWEDRMKMILNEYRLMPWQKEAQELIAKHMEDFFFGQGAALPPGYVPQQTK